MRNARVDTFSLKTAFLLRNKSNQRSDEAMAVFRVERNTGYTVMEVSKGQGYNTEIIKTDMNNIYLI